MLSRLKNLIVIFAPRVALVPMRCAAAVVVCLVLAANSAEAQQMAPLVRINLDETIRLAFRHNHGLLAARTTILQSEAQEVTAKLRPNPALSADYNFVPAFSPSFFGVPASQAPLPQEADATVAYILELWHKRQDRLAAARDQSAVTRSLVGDNERNLTFAVASQFISVLLAESNPRFSQQDLKSFQNTVDISAERYRAGAISEGDYLKIKLQLLQSQ